MGLWWKPSILQNLPQEDGLRTLKEQPWSKIRLHQFLGIKERLSQEGGYSCFSRVRMWLAMADMLNSL